MPRLNELSLADQTFDRSENFPRDIFFFVFTENVFNEIAIDIYSWIY